MLEIKLPFFFKLRRKPRVISPVGFNNYGIVSLLRAQELIDGVTLASRVPATFSTTVPQRHDEPATHLEQSAAAGHAQELRRRGSRVAALRPASLLRIPLAAPRGNSNADQNEPFNRSSKAIFRMALVGQILKVDRSLARNYRASGMASIISYPGACRIVNAADKLFSLDGRVALVTGASRGLGLAMAEALAEAGATVILNGRNAGTLRIEADRLRDRGLKAETLAFDVTDCAAADLAIQSIIADHRRLDVLIANAGIIHRAQLGDWTSEAWDQVVAANLTACFFLAQRAAAPMRSQGHGRIIFITSIVGILGRRTVHAYAALKSGLAGLARSLAAELGDHGITCNSIAPGWFETEFTAALLRDEAFVERINNRVPLRRWGKPRDLAGAAIFLASDAASYVTAQQIVVDGGLSATM
jgi:gluconate 5-dehydrogenase